MAYNNFERDPRRRQEIAGRPIADKVYRDVFGSATEIVRMEREDQKVLDIRFAIDVKLVLPSGQILLGQEKFLSHKYAKYSSVTVEYEQNQWTHEQGDWFKLCSQFYFVGYMNEQRDTFTPWIILNWPNVVLATLQKRVPWRQNKNNNGRARASFKYCGMKNFPKDCIIAMS